MGQKSLEIEQNKNKQPRIASDVGLSALTSGVPAALQNICEEEAFVINMPHPAWTPDMNDEHTADFSDFDFTLPDFE